jgi:hypothetical protein
MQIEPSLPKHHFLSTNSVKQLFYALTSLILIHFADEERIELSTFGLTNRCSSIELFIHRCPAGIRTQNPPVKSRIHLPVELRDNIYLYGFWIWTKNFLLLFSFHKEREKTMLPYTKPYWLTPGLEPCSSLSQCDTLYRLYIRNSSNKFALNGCYIGIIPNLIWLLIKCNWYYLLS